MPKPPKATPHSDIDGVHRDEVRNTELAADMGEGGEKLARAQEESVGRPEYSDDRNDREDRSK